MSTKEYKGHCFCGETEFTAKGSPEHVLCHCNTCKYLSGAPFTLNQIVPKDNFKVTKGETKTFTYTGDSGNKVHCYYCPNCTTHIAHQQMVQADNMIVRTALLDGAKDFPVTIEIYTKDKANWQPEIAAKTFKAGPE